MSINVEIPYEIDLGYTSFCAGFQMANPELIENGEFLRFKFKSNTVFVVFLYFEKFRRAYICREYNGTGTVSHVLGCGDRKLQVILCARGHTIDHLKRFIYDYTKDDMYGIYDLPLQFWVKVANLLQRKDYRKTYLDMVYKQYIKKTI